MQTPEKFRHCEVCGSYDAENIYHQRFILPEGYPFPSKYDILCCKQCGFIFANTGVSQIEYDRYYKSLSIYSSAKTQETEMKCDAWQLKRFFKISDNIKKFVPSLNANILDIGCANGELLSVLKQYYGYRNLYGIDPSKHCVKNATFKDINARVGTLFSKWVKIPKMDLIILSHVLEHVRDLAKALIRLKSLMKPQALLYIEVPDAKRYSNFLHSPFQDINTEHINHFSKISLSNILSSCGYECLTLREKNIFSSPGSPYPAIWCIATVSDIQKWKKDVNLRNDFIRIS